MHKSTVAIIGRPNVGKSTLFNKLVGKKVSITEKTPGVTRDRIYGDVEWANYKFTIIDTGGFEIDINDYIQESVLKQTISLLDTVDLILFLVDAREGLTAIDSAVAIELRKKNKNIILVINKIDDFVRDKNNSYEFYSLGFSDISLISAESSLGIGDLLDKIINKLQKTNSSCKIIENDNNNSTEDKIKVAIIGRPNVGKSSLINKILGYSRVIVSDIPGTTRDAIDIEFEKDLQKYVLVDTAGIRKKNKVRKTHNNLEYYSILRAVNAIENADICVLLLDATENITEQDVKIAGVAYEKHKPLIVAINKWDLIENKTDKITQTYSKEINLKLSYIPYMQKIFISALTGQRLNKVFDLIKVCWQNYNLTIKTNALNEVIIEAIKKNPPVIRNGRRFKVYYATQVKIKPPTFILFVNTAELLHFSYKRYLENEIRNAFNFIATPIRLVFKNKPIRDKIKLATSNRRNT